MATYEQQTEDCEHTDVWSHVCVHLLNLKSIIRLNYFPPLYHYITASYWGEHQCVL